MSSVPKRPRAAIYPRVSTPGQEHEGSSLETQEAACRAYAEQHGYEVVEVYREVYSGIELWDRPRLAALREAVRREQIDVVIAYAIDRLSRDPVHLGVILSEADHHHVAVAFVSEPLDDTPEGELIRFVRGYAAKVEHVKITERAKRGLAHRLASGKLGGSRVLYGYQWTADRTAYAVVPERGAVVARIFDAALGGATLRAIARDLTDDGILTPKGGRTWSYTSVVKILKNQRYTGRAVVNQNANLPVKGTTPSGRQRRQIRPRPVAEHVVLPEGVIPPLVSQAAFAAVAERLRLNAAHSARNTHEPEAYLLRGGYARCGHCRRAMSGFRMTTGRRMYRCTGAGAGAGGSGCYHGITSELLDEAVWARLERVLTTPEVIAAELEKGTRDDPSEPDLEAIDRTLTDVDRKLGNLTRRMAGEDDDDVAELIRSEVRALAEQKRALAAERDAALAHHATRLALREQTDRLIAWCRQVATTLGDFDYQKRRLALDALGVVVTVWRADHAPRYLIEAGIPLDEPAIVYPTARRAVQKIALSWTDRAAS